MNITTVLKLNNDKNIVIKFLEKIRKEFFKINNAIFIYNLGLRSINNNYFQTILYKNDVFIFKVEYDKNNKEFYYTSIYKVHILNKEIKSKNDYCFEIIKENSNDKNSFSIDLFNEWLYFPNELNEYLDIKYVEIINFILNYKLDDFKYKHYVFYPKFDIDTNPLYNIYIKNLKSNYEVKIYIDYLNDETGNNYPPKKLKDCAIYDFKNELSANQKTRFKKAFLEFSKDKEKYNYLQLLKQLVNPIEIESHLCWHRIFSNKAEFSNIWVEDFYKKNEKPYFMLTNDNYTWQFNKIAVIDFCEAEYTKKFYKQGIYKSGNVKKTFWELDKEYIEQLVKFLQAPYKLDEYSTLYEKKYKPKTNWEKIVLEYNLNSATLCNLDEPYEDTIVLPMDLKMPNYLKLIKE